MVAGRMRQVVLQEAGRIEIVHVAVPRPRRGEALVRSRLVGICGSDLHALHGTHPFIDLPVTPGHEVVGIVEEVGPGVTAVVPGQRVLLEPNLVCRECAYCRSGRYNLCEELQVVGCQVVGAMADFFTVPVHRLHVIPEGMTDTAASLVEPLATAVHAVRMAGGDVRGKRVAILGAGTIGLLTLVAVREAGARAIAVTDLHPDKLERAKRLGAVIAVNGRDAAAVETIRAGLVGRPDVTFDCVSTQASMAQAVALAHKGGTVVVVGVATGPVQIPLPMIQDGEIRIEGSAMYVNQDVRRAIDLVQAGVVPGQEIVTACFPLDGAAQAFEAAADGHHVKVQLAVEGEPRES